MIQSSGAATKEDDLIDLTAEKGREGKIIDGKIMKSPNVRGTRIGTMNRWTRKAA